MSKPDNYLEKPPEDVNFSEKEWKELSYDMQYYHANEWRRENVQKRKNRKKKWGRKLKENEKCRLCGESTACALDWHHVEESDYENKISKLVGRDYARQKILDEIKKCVLLCANCHRKHHEGLLSEDIDDFPRGKVNKVLEPGD